MRAAAFRGIRWKRVLESMTTKMPTRRLRKPLHSRASKAKPSTGVATRNAEQTRQEILAAATAEFAAKGFMGARIDKIANRYGGSKNMIYHYFDSKDGLFTAVLEGMYATIRDRQRDFEVKGRAPVEGIRALVQFTVDVFDEHPEFVSLLHSENIAQGKHIKRSAAIKAMYNPLMETIDDLVSRGITMGLFRSDTSSVDLYICICAMAAYSISNRYTLSAIFGTDIYAPKRRNMRRRQISDMLVGYLQYK